MTICSEMKPSISMFIITHYRYMSSLCNSRANNTKYFNIGSYCYRSGSKLLRQYEFLYLNENREYPPLGFSIVRTLDMNAETSSE